MARTSELLRIEYDPLRYLVSRALADAGEGQAPSAATRKGLVEFWTEVERP